jgi:hypothetical protein
MKTFVQWALQDETSPQRVALTVIHFGMMAWGTFAMITWGWFCFVWLPLSKPFPWRWIVLASLIGGAAGAHGMWIVRRKRRLIAP